MLVSSTIPSNLSIPHLKKKETVIDRNNHFYINAQCQIAVPYGSKLHIPAKLLMSTLSIVYARASFPPLFFFLFFPSFFPSSFLALPLRSLLLFCFVCLSFFSSVALYSTSLTLV